MIGDGSLEALIFVGNMNNLGANLSWFGEGGIHIWQIGRTGGSFNKVKNRFFQEKVNFIIFHVHLLSFCPVFVRFLIFLPFFHIFSGEGQKEITR